MESSPLSEEQKRVLWFVRIRWGAIILIASIVFFLKHIQGANIPLLPSFLLIVFAAIFNTFYPVLALYYKPFSESAIYNYLRATIDFLVITLFIHFTGGIESPFILLYLLELVTISIFGFAVFAYFLAGQATIFFTVICALEAYFIIPHYQLSNQPGALFLSLNYIFSRAFALFFTCVLLIYMTSYLSKKLTQKQKQIEELSNAQVNFMNQVMHETKSPLTSIIGYTDTLLKGSFGEIHKEQKDPLHIIKRQSVRILNMTNDLLDLSRLESVKSKIEKKPASLGEVIERAIEEMRPLLDGKKLDLVKEIDPGLPPAPMNENKILQVLINLLSNAVKFSKPGGKVFISTELLDRSVQVSVRDEGMGIDPEDLPHIFERFYRASKETVAVRGTGLGLALTKGILEAHGGRIWAVSGGPDKGAVFYFTLPL
ncbi:MAG: HAMP domain-containing sensor histidine kinase [Candidatus Margulisiibacteriota bacterium]